MSDSDRGRPDVHTQPDSGIVGPTPDVHIQPDDGLHRPDVHTLPDEVEILPDCRPPRPSQEELEMALHRARLVSEEISSVLGPALKAMEDGAWVSRTADEFSTGLTTHSGQAAAVAERCVETIQEAIDRPGPYDVDPMPL